MSAPLPTRFKIESVEMSIRASVDNMLDKVGESKSAHRFAPQPIEATIRTHCKSVLEPVQKTHKFSRRFAPEPIETTYRSSRDSRGQRVSKNSSREKFAEDWASQTSRSNLKNKDEGVSKRNSRDKFTEEWAAQTAKTNFNQDGKARRPPRRFTPQLLETAKRTRRAGDSAPATLPSDKADAGAGVDVRTARKLGIRPVPCPSGPANTPITDFSNNPLFLEIQRATSPLSMRRPASLSSIRSHHSYCVPMLDPIESSESEPEGPPSPSTSHSATSDHFYMCTKSTKMRESVVTKPSGELLELAAKAAEKQLREQVMAAFPNEDHHEHVDHYVDRDVDEGDSHSEEAKRRRESTFEEAKLEFLAMQRHREKIEKEQALERERKKKREAEFNKGEKVLPKPWVEAAAVCGAQQDSELDLMRKGARPPMLGENIEFPRCSSPEPARFDTTQGCDAVRKAMCYLSEQQSHQEEKGDSLWCFNTDTGHKNPCSRPSLYSNASSRPPSRPPSRQGLWGGSCMTSGQTPPRGPTGLLTPNIEIDNVFSPCPSPSRNVMPPTPPSGADFDCIDEKLTAQAKIEEEFSDDFVTQIYNYLSLGYPSIARIFDDELAKVSQFSVMELRQDDHLRSSRGYIRLGPDGNLADANITEESCMRWRALRAYVRVWAKQQPNMASDNTPGTGVAARKGSWAV
jgi:hypothetical protein